ncbi:MAG: hypothetical protein M1828_002595 [Chrysothrix sp. TS-e1954]|nr:MAG: hypothetical protein M1828_002595 [Chrysothrix sp. TS-e1954]
MAQTQQLMQWALPRLSSLLPLDEDSLKQVITYTDTLPKQAASDHLKNLLGDSPQAFEFISAFNTRRPTPPGETPSSRSLAPTSRNGLTGSTNGSRDASESETGGVPRARPKQTKKKQPFNKLPAPRQPENSGDTAGSYKKKDQQDEYMSSSQRQKQPPLSNTLSLDPTPSALQVPSTVANHLNSSAETSPTHSPAPTASPISSAAPSRTSSPAPSSQKPKPTKSKAQSTTLKFTANSKTMHAPSTSLSDLDAAIRTLESTTNPSLPSNSASATKARTCNCQAQRHALLSAAPNCINCGKIICVKEGMGPCTSCGVPLLKSADVQDMLKTLREERGRERTQIHNQSHSKPDVSQKPRPFANNQTPTPSRDPSAAADDEAKLAAARSHKNRLLTYQTENTKRTTIHDEAADFSTPDTGISIWATPTQRALQLKKQQKVLREQEWNAKQDFEKRRVVLEIDPATGRAVRKMQALALEEEHGSDDDEGRDYHEEQPRRRAAEEDEGPAGFARNPFLGQLIRPVCKSKHNPLDTDTKGKERASNASNASNTSKADEASNPPRNDPTTKQPPRRNQRTWRTTNAIVQDDNDDNSDIILDGGAYGERIDARVLGAEERAVG